MKFQYATVLSAGVALAQVIVENESTGVGPYPNGSMSEFQSAIANPLASRQADFSLYDDDNAPTWQWRVRLAEADAPDSDIPNARVLNTVYDLSFPNAPTLNQAVADNSGQLNVTNFCVTVVDSLFPGKTTNHWKDDSVSNLNTEGSCQTPLRKRCAEAIASAWGNSVPDANGCRGTDVDPSQIKQCDWAFDGWSARTYNLVGNFTNNNASFPLVSGAGFSHVTTNPYDGTNRTWFNQEDLRMHMIIIDSGSTYTPLCMRVNSSEDARSVDTGASQGAASLGVSLNSWLLLAAGFVALAYAV